MKTEQIIDSLAALAHEHRLAVYRMLVQAGPGGLPAGVIAERLGVPPSSLTFHTQALVRAGLAMRRRESRQIIYAADFSVMTGLVNYLTENCCGGRVVCTPARTSVRSKSPSGARRRAARKSS